MNTEATQTAATIDICVCTYRRFHLVDTLESLARLSLRRDWHVRVIVADNDEVPHVAGLLESLKRTFPFPILCLHAPARNISIARNACLDAATADYVAFIDDDETVAPDWLRALLQHQKRTGADVVLGPVDPLYPPRCANWMRREKFHAIRPVWVHGEIITGYTSNALFLRKSPAVDGLRFDPKLGRSGGEDTLFFATIFKAGGRITYAPDAIVSENITRDRLAFFWLVRRAFRSGQTHGLLLLGGREASLWSRVRYSILAGVKSIFCAIVAIGALVTGGRTRYWILRGTLHAGAVAHMSGWPELIQYG